MTTKPLLFAIMFALPFGAMAENISGAMYVAPATEDTNHPQPITYAYPPYGRIDIDTTDQDHIASTAYVKGAYNSAIAAVNTVASIQNSDRNELFGQISIVSSDLSSKRIDVYTTWDTTDTVQTMLSNQIIRVELE